MSLTRNLQVAVFCLIALSACSKKVKHKPKDDGAPSIENAQQSPTTEVTAPENGTNTAGNIPESTDSTANPSIRANSPEQLEAINALKASIQSRAQVIDKNLKLADALKEDQLIEVNINDTKSHRTFGSSYNIKNCASLNERIFSNKKYSFNQYQASVNKGFKSSSKEFELMASAPANKSDLIKYNIPGVSVCPGLRSDIFEGERIVTHENKKANQFAPVILITDKYEESDKKGYTIVFAKYQLADAELPTFKTHKFTISRDTGVIVSHEMHTLMAGKIVASVIIRQNSDGWMMKSKNEIDSENSNEVSEDVTFITADGELKVVQKKRTTPDQVIKTQTDYEYTTKNLFKHFQVIPVSEMYTVHVNESKQAIDFGLSMILTTVNNGANTCEYGSTILNNQNIEFGDDSCLKSYSIDSIASTKHFKTDDEIVF